MNTFRKLKIIRTFIARIPGLKSPLDFDIVVEVGYAQRAGAPLTLKQLLLLDHTSSATMRRHLARLIREGTVLKNTAPNDHRTVHFTLSEQTITTLEDCLERIHETLCEPGQCASDR